MQIEFWYPCTLNLDTEAPLGKASDWYRVIVAFKARAEREQIFAKFEHISLLRYRACLYLGEQLAKKNFENQATVRIAATQLST